MEVKVDEHERYREGHGGMRRERREGKKEGERGR